MKRSISHLLFIAFIALVSCVDDPEIPPSNVGFPTEYVYYSEFEGIFLLPVTLDKPQFAYSTIDFQTIYRNNTTKADFSYVNNIYPLTLYGKEQIANISGGIADDTLKDGNDTLRFTLTNTSSNLSLSSDVKKRTGSLVVIDDDNMPANQMMIQLKWLATGAKNDKLDADFDLTLFTDVVIANGQIDKATAYKISDKTNSFESITIDDTAPDKDYYIAIEYIWKNSSVNGNATPILKLSGFGNLDRLNNNRWSFSFSKDEVGYYTWLGPFKKTGRKFIPAWK